MVDLGYDQLEALASSPNPEISRLGLEIISLRKRIEWLEKKQTELLDKINEVSKK